VPQGAISGLTLSNATVPPGQGVNIAPGEASDSTQSVTLQLATQCLVNLADRGAGGLDTGSAAADTTYFYFLVGSASGGNTSCMASASQTPSFMNTNYSVSVSGTVYNGVPWLYNLPSTAGILAGQTVSCSCITSGTLTATSVGTVTSDVVGSNSGGAATFNISSGSLANVGVGMAVSDMTAPAGGGCTPAGIISPGATISGTSGTTITVSGTIRGSATNDCITISGGRAIGLSATPTATGGATATVYNGLYRLVGALYTDAASDVVGFVQDGDTFYLSSSVTDIQTGGPGFLCAPNIGLGARSCPLSVPCGRTAATCASPGFQVAAFGRVVGGTGDILLSSLDQNEQPPNVFPGPPGYTTYSATATTAAPFHTYTDGNGNVRVQANTGSNTVYEVTDGWVLDRAEAGSVSVAAAGAGKQASVTPKRAKVKHQYRN